MKFRAALLAYLLLGSVAFGQSVQQGGNITPGHAVQWSTNGVIQDAGTAASGSLTSLGVTNNGGPGICVNNAPITTDYNSFCMSVTESGGGILSLDNHGSASGGISVLINGVLIPLGGTSITVGTTTVLGGTTGNVLYDNGGILGNFDLFASPHTWTSLQTFNGSATVPTALPGDTTTTVASTAFVQNAVTGIGLIAPANSMLSNWTNVVGSSIPNAIPSCPDTGGNHLNYITGSGMLCGSSGGGGGGGSAAGSLTGTTMAANVVISSLTTVGNLTGGSTGAGFTIQLGSSTLTGSLPTANLPAFAGGDVTSSAGSAVLTIGNLKVTNAMIANGTINLTTKVTNVLPIANGGTGASTAATALSSLGALPLAGGTMVGNLILNADPTTSLQAATKQYVDNNSSGSQPKAAVAAASTANVNISSAPSTLDTVTGTAGMRWLLKNQTTVPDNGIYVFASAGAALTRATDLDFWPEVVGAFTLVLGGTQLDTGWTAQVTAGGTIGTTPMPWVQTSAQTVYSAGSGLALSSNTFSIAAGGVTNAMLAGSITASKLVGSDITTVGNITSGGWLASAVGTAHGGTGQDLSATSGVILITGGVASMISGGTGSGGVVRDTNSSAANLTVTGTLTANQELHLIGTLPNIQMDPTSGATKTTVIYQGGDTFRIGAAGIADYIALNLNTGAVGINTTAPMGTAGNFTISASGQSTLYMQETSGVATHKVARLVYDGGGIVAGGGWIFQKTDDSGTFQANLVTVVSNTGFVGLGALNPAAHFEVQDAGSAYNSGIGSIVISNTSDPNKRLGLGYDTSLGTQGSGWIQAVRPGIIFTPLLLNPNAGNVGINNISPQAALDVNGSILVPNNVAYQSRQTGGGLVNALYIDGSNVTQVGGGTNVEVPSSLGVGAPPQTPFYVHAGTDQNLLVSTTGPNALFWFRNNANTAFVGANIDANPLVFNQYVGSTILLMNSNVGININPPTQLLDVNGNTVVRGAMAVGGTTFSRVLAVNSSGVGISFIDGGEQWAIGVEGGGAAERFSFYSPAFGYALILDHSNGAASFSSSISAATSIGAGTSITAGSTISANSNITSATVLVAPELALVNSASPVIVFGPNSGASINGIIQQSGNILYSFGSGGGATGNLQFDLSNASLGFSVSPHTGTAGVAVNPGIAIGQKNGAGTIFTNPYVDSHDTTSGLVVKLVDQDASTTYNGSGLEFALIGSILSTHNTGTWPSCTTRCANKVGTMGSAELNGANSGVGWGMYAECQLDGPSFPPLGAAAATSICIGIEIDINNQQGDRSTDYGNPAYGLQITGASAYTSTAALFISAGGLTATTQWYTGILYVGNGMHWGIDFSPDVTPSNFFAAGAIRIPNNTAIAWRTFDTLTTVNAFYLDTGNRFQLGGGYPIGANLQANAASWVVCWDGNLISYQDWNVGCPSSSERFKQNITPISLDRTFNIATNLAPVSFQYKPELYKSDQKVDEQTHLGFIAEQVVKVDPALVSYDDGGLPVGVKYNELWPIVMGAIQHLKADNDNLRARLEALEAKVSNAR